MQMVKRGDCKSPTEKRWEFESLTAHMTNKKKKDERDLIEPENAQDREDQMFLEKEYDYSKLEELRKKKKK